LRGVLASLDVVALGERGFFVHDDWLGREPALAVHRELETLAAEGRLRPAGVSRGTGYRVDSATRGDAILWLTPEDSPPAVTALVAELMALRDALNREAYVGLDHVELQLARYAGGGARYRRHRDAVAGRGSRRVTAIYYTNPVWREDHGGALRLHLPDGPVDVAPILDRLVVFLSERLEHEVRPTFATRLAVTTWLYGRDRAAAGLV
jgi:SM-20-related protein